MGIRVFVVFCEFLSTPSARRATFSRRSGCAWSIYFYPRPPRGGRREPKRILKPQRKISIHALREEGDAGALNLVAHDLISIHALREEGDGCPFPA